MNKGLEINRDFTDWIRLSYCETIFNFDEKSQEIVLQKFTHNNLLSNNNIDEHILKFYYLPTLRNITDKEFQKMVSTGYVGSKENTLIPYSLIIDGAYYTRIGMYYKLKLCTEIGYTINKKPIKYLNDLIPYFKEYRKGFENGFNEFENECINPFLTMFADKADFINKVFEYVTKQILFSHSWLSNNIGFAINMDKEIVIDKAIKYGQTQGYFYKAWTLILSNNNLFAPLFIEYFKNKQNPAQQPESIKKDEIKKDLHNHIFKNNAFEVWQSMFDEFEITEASRTDVKFMYEEMKKESEGLIYNTVNQKAFLEWITSTYDGLIIQKTSNHSRTKARLQAYSRAKKLYKK